MKRETNRESEERKVYGEKREKRNREAQKTESMRERVRGVKEGRRRNQ